MAPTVAGTNTMVTPTQGVADGTNQPTSAQMDGLLPSSTVARRETIAAKLELDRELGVNARKYWLKVEDFLHGRCTRAELDAVVSTVLQRSKFKFHNRLLFSIFHNVYKRTAIPPRNAVPLFSAPLESKRGSIAGGDFSSIDSIVSPYATTLTTEQWRNKYREREIRSFANADQRGLQGLLSFDRTTRLHNIQRNMRTILPTPPYSVLEGSDDGGYLSDGESTSGGSHSRRQQNGISASFQDPSILPRLCTESYTTPSLEELRGVQDAYARREGLEGVESEDCTKLMALGLEYMLRSYVSEIISRSHSDMPPYGSRAYYYENIRTVLDQEEQNLDEEENAIDEDTETAVTERNPKDYKNASLDVVNTASDSSKIDTAARSKYASINVKQTIVSPSSDPELDSAEDDEQVSSAVRINTTNLDTNKRSTRSKMAKSSPNVDTTDYVKKEAESIHGDDSVEASTLDHNTQIRSVRRSSRHQDNAYKSGDENASASREDGKKSGRGHRRQGSSNLDLEVALQENTPKNDFTTKLYNAKRPREGSESQSQSEAKHYMTPGDGVTTRVHGKVEVAPSEILLSDIKLTAEIRPTLLTRSVGGLRCIASLGVTPDNIDGTLEENVGRSKKLKH